MDDLSLRILRLLEQDASVSVEQIATMLGATPQDVARRVEDLERSRVIVRRKAIVNWERSGFETVAALIEVKVSPQRDVGFDNIAARIARFAETRNVYLVSGTYDLAVEVVGRTMKDVASFVSEKLAPLDGVQATTTHFLLRRYKIDGELLEETNPMPRLPYTP
jgi:DNA-binding Lrp family transcriptional regulator